MREPNNSGSGVYDVKEDVVGLDMDTILIPLHVEDLRVERHEVKRGTAQLRIHTNIRDHLVEEILTDERIAIERVAIGRPIDASPPIRVEGDTTIISVVEEIVVVERRLILKEEIHLRRVQTNTLHHQSIELREQEAIITRASANSEEEACSARPPHSPTNVEAKGLTMTNETIVAVYDTAAHAAAAVQDLENAGVPASAITQHSKEKMAAAEAAAPVHTPGFWESLFGGTPELAHDTTVYNRSLEGGSTVVTVKAPDRYPVDAMDILERHNPIDIDERAAGYDVRDDTERQPIGGASVAAPITIRSDDDQTIQLAEETLAVGKRAINSGTTRIRRYVVESPIEEEVTLRDQTISMERRPITDNRPVTDANFSDQIVEMTETQEELVIAKTARIKEELVIHKDTAERTETVHDTVRREDVEITREPGVDSAGVTIETRPSEDPTRKA